jgi:hypothetical protein
MGTLGNQLEMGTGAVKADRPAKHKGGTSGALRKRQNSGPFVYGNEKTAEIGLLTKTII